MKKLTVLGILLLSLCSFETLIRSAAPPQGFTGADGVYCNNCHAGNTFNNTGGSVTAAGLPLNGYTAGTTYNFSVVIQHSAADRKRWGFSIIAKNSLGQTVGTFNSSNANAALNGPELSHLNAITFPSASNSYTYGNLSWTAPQNPTAADQDITFYVAGVAANGTGNNTGDFVYSATQVISLVAASTTYTFTGNGNWENAANWSNNLIPPSTITGNAHIVIDPVAGGECVLNGEQHVTQGATFAVADGKRFRTTGNLVINN